MSYEVDADDLFPPSPTASNPSPPRFSPPRFTPPSPKRPRPSPPYQRTTSLGPLNLPSFTSNIRPTQNSYATPNPLAPRQPPGPKRVPKLPDLPSRDQYPQIHPATNHLPKRGDPYARKDPYVRNGAYVRHEPYAQVRPPGNDRRPTNEGFSNSFPPPLQRGPMGRGKAMTLPAHIRQTTRPPSLPANLSLMEKEVHAAATVLPEEDRERFIEKELRKRRVEEEKGAPERKRPSKRRRTDNVKKIQQKSMMARQGGRFQGLTSLMAAASAGANGSTGTKKGGKRSSKALTSGDRYRNVTMTKEMKAKEERLKQEGIEKIEDEERRTREHFEERREYEKELRREQAGKWKREKTVASVMRDANKMMRLEMELFGDAEKGIVTLSSLGLKLKGIEDNTWVTQLMTVEVSEI